MSEIILRYVFYGYWNLHLKTKAGMKPGFDWKTEYELADEFVWVNVINCMLWVSLIAYPANSFLAVIIIYFHSKFLIYRLQNQKKQPLAASDDMSTGSLMNMYVTFTFMIVFTFNAILIFFKTPRYKFWNSKSNTLDSTKNCGPFLSNGELSPIDEVKFFPDENSLTNRIALSLLV